MSEVDDREILRLFKEEGKKDNAFNLIVIKYQERIYWHIRKMVLNHADTDDILQNVFIKIWNNLAQFREDSNLFTWIYRIATNESLDHLRKKKKKNHLSDELFIEMNFQSLKSDPYFDGDDLQLKLQKAILHLPEKQRIVFNMKYYDDMKYEDMSEILKTSTGALKASYHHAVSKIKKYLELE